MRTLLEKTITILGCMIIALFLLISLFCGTNAIIDYVNSHGGKRHITLYQNGKIINQWITAGRVGGGNGDYAYFIDDATKQRVGITGTYIIDSNLSLTQTNQ